MKSSSVHSAFYLSLLACLHLGVPSNVYFLVAYPGVKHIANRSWSKLSIPGGECVYFFSLPLPLDH